MKLRAALPCGAITLKLEFAKHQLHRWPLSRRAILAMQSIGCSSVDSGSLSGYEGILAGRSLRTVGVTSSCRPGSRLHGEESALIRDCKACTKDVQNTVLTMCKLHSTFSRRCCPLVTMRSCVGQSCLLHRNVLQ